MTDAAARLENMVSLAKERRREQLAAELAALDAPCAPPALREPENVADWLNAVLATLAGMTPASAEEIAKDRETRRIRPRLSAAGVQPEHLPALTSLTSHGRQKNALAKMRGMIAAGNGAICILVGPRGTGKTQMAAQIFRDLAEREVAAEDAYADHGRAVNEADEPRAYLAAHPKPPLFSFDIRYLTAARLFGRMKELFANVGTIKAEERQAEMDLLAACDLVAVDELQESTDPAEKRVGFGRILTALCDARYAAKKPTILISNHYDPAKPNDLTLISAFLGDSIVSRAQQHGGFIIADWKSFRENQPQKP